MHALLQCDIAGRVGFDSNNNNNDKKKKIIICLHI
jgi:hypothetical protein